nr:MAG TPA: hypothetical protein [Caudoviricetes sp.]
MEISLSAEYNGDISRHETFQRYKKIREKTPYG